ncbi:MAG: bifunctional diaminohydroxyphosphoribosylaminopyrimidine deaminase/5-amino-6-(5-phosphoribosylamino)uracil reductase RibD [Elusimicrobia bacterium]|nr:bifunctional diaminohydroxyphosphoribosylaminopyrimidine deaminase/5-amino-6-(5-phosphoribosylamino)uracil reductase RibD [Elusimicrobiota bacterium]
MISDSYFMQKAVDLAHRGMNLTSTNPRVGCVIVKDGRIIGSGYHKKFGGPHAEAEAISSAFESLEYAAVFVTLEPCSHTGKTPPCTQKIIDSGIKRVVIGMKDPNPEVDGIKVLKEKGIEVTTGVLKKECAKLMRDFLKYISLKKPYVTIKAAMSLDGKIAARNGSSKWISSTASREYAMKLRGMSDAIMVGARTALLDNPKLTYRLRVPAADDPVRVVVDGKLSLKSNLDIISKGTVIIAAEGADKEKEKIFTDKGAQVIKLPVDNRGLIKPGDILNALYGKNIMSLLIEGGSKTIGAFLDAGQADSIVFIYAPVLIGGKKAPGVYGAGGVADIKDKLKVKNINLFDIGKDFVVEGDLR